MRVKALVPAVCIGILLVLSGLAHGVEVKGLYKTIVEVPDRSNNSLRHGSQEALAEVVIRVSGDSKALEAYDITQAMAEPDRYIEQFSFDRQVRVDPETNLPEPYFLLNVTFNPRSINQLIRRAGLPIWASNRPEVLLWLVIEDAQGRRLVNSDTAPEIAKLLTVQARRRGLPLAFPINDLQDQLGVSAGDVWGMFMDPIVEASARYGASAILVGKVYPPGPDGLRGAWTYRMDDSQEFFETRGLELAEVLTPAVDFAADQLAAKYAVVLGEGDTDYIWLSVEGVANLKDFADLTDYLDKLVAVKQASMDRLQEASVRFRLYLESDVENLRQLLKLDRKLIALPDSGTPPAPGVRLSATDGQRPATSGPGGSVAPAAGQGDLASPQDADNMPEAGTGPGMSGTGPDTESVKDAEPVRPAVELRYHWHRTYSAGVSGQ
ncbi:MAG: DUF2066 domain-containing protein [Ketobacteraceae bacterium]|nr:DUF2066 domain-containing protein [Ketobacteraceae bacterium]